MFRCFSSLSGVGAVIGVTLTAGYVVFWHGQHLAALLPVLLVLAYPLAHLLMHGFQSR